MSKYVSKRKKRNRLLKIVLIAFALFAVVTVIIFTGFGNSIIKHFLETKIDRYIKNARITYLDYGINSFAVNVQQKDNRFNIFGETFPLNAMLECKIKNLSLLNANYRGSMTVNGRVWYNNKYNINGMAYFADGDMKYSAVLKPFSFHAEGSEFNVSKLLYMAKIDLKNIKALTGITLNCANGVCNIKLNTVGNYNGKIKAAFKAESKLKFKNREHFRFKSRIISNIGDFNISGNVKNETEDVEFKGKNINLEGFRAYLIYPMKGFIDISGEYNSNNGILKFKNRDLEGFYDGKSEITFKIGAKRFFDYLNLKHIFNADVTGIVKIYKKYGTFDIVSNNTHLLNFETLRRIYRLTGINLAREKINRIFIKGRFDSNKVVFDLLSTNDKVTLNIKKGEYYYNGDYEFVLYLRKNNGVYKLKISNKGIKVLEKKTIHNSSNQILVY